MTVIEVDLTLALDAAVFTAVGAGHKRLCSVFREVATQLPVEKREVKASLQRLRKAGRVKCDCVNGHWSEVKQENEPMVPTSEQIAEARANVREMLEWADIYDDNKRAIETLLAATEQLTK